MIWKMAALTMALMGCSERPLDNPTPPPEPPSADLWPLGGQIYHGIPLPDAADASPDTTPDVDAPPAAEEPAEALEEVPPEAEAPIEEPSDAPAEEPPPEAPPTEVPATEETP